jgi:hypothetical protein
MTKIPPQRAAQGLAGGDAHRATIFNMVAEPHSLLPLDEMTRPRTAAQLASWVADRCEAFAQDESAREPGLMHRRPFKEFYEEIYPLSLWATRYYSGREAVYITPNLDNRPFDAVVRDSATAPPSELLVEITTAQSPQQHLYMEYFLEHGNVWPWAPLSAVGTKRNRKIHVEPMMVDQSELVDRHCGWIKAAAEGKASKADHYSRSHVLLIVFDDYFYPTPADITTITDFVNQNVLPLSLNFAKLYLVGISGQTHLSFPLI